MTARTVARRPSRQHLTLILAILSSLSCNVVAFSSFQKLEAPWKAAPRTTTLCMTLTPTGPFCPFRSSAAEQMEPTMENIITTTPPDIATEIARIQLDIETGNTPDPDRLRRVAQQITDSTDQWESVIMRLRLSSDFQTREYAKLTQAHLENADLTQEEVTSLMRWQAACMVAMADNTLPPMPPPELDLTKLMNQAQGQTQKAPPPSVEAMMASGKKITTTPFTVEEEAFKSPTVREEYEVLCQDHMRLIEMGGSYANFDPSGKLAFLDEIDKVQDRWHVFFTRFQLLGQLNKDFVRQCNEFLASMGMDEEQYNELLKKTHQIMRDDAEQERLRGGL